MHIHKLFLFLVFLAPALSAPITSAVVSDGTYVALGNVNAWATLFAPRTADPLTSITIAGADQRENENVGYPL